MAMTYGSVYVASVAMGAKDEHTLKAFLEAEAYDGPSIIIAYSHCIAHGIDMTTAMTDQKVAIESGQWLLYRYNPERAEAGENPLVLDSRAPTRKVQEYLLQQTRFKMLTKSKPEEAEKLWKLAQQDAEVAITFTNTWPVAKRNRLRLRNRPPRSSPQKTGADRLEVAARGG